MLRYTRAAIPVGVFRELRIVSGCEKSYFLTHLCLSPVFCLRAQRSWPLVTKKQTLRKYGLNNSSTKSETSVVAIGTCNIKTLGTNGLIQSARLCLGWGTSVGGERRTANLSKCMLWLMSNYEFPLSLKGTVRSRVHHVISIHVKHCIFSMHFFRCIEARTVGINRLGKENIEVIQICCGATGADDASGQSEGKMILDVLVLLTTWIRSLER